MDNPTPQACARQHCREILRQALTIATAYFHRPQAYGELAGPHLRHVLEHYEALLSGLATGLVDYDSRRRERAVEMRPALALERLQHALLRCSEIDPAVLGEALAVRFACGVRGGHSITAESTAGRELMFLAHHAIHHFALLKPGLLADGLALPAEFGIAPATVRARQLCNRTAHRPVPRAPSQRPSRRSKLRQVERGRTTRSSHSRRSHQR